MPQNDHHDHTGSSWIYEKERGCLGQATYLPAAESVGSAGGAMGCAIHTALSVIAAVDSFSSLQTARSSFCNTDTSSSGIQIFCQLVLYKTQAKFASK